MQKIFVKCPKCGKESLVAYLEEKPDKGDLLVVVVVVTVKYRLIVTVETLIK